MEHTSNILFSIGPLEVTKTVVTMWVIIVVLGFVSWLATRRLKEVPGPIQSAAEMAVPECPAPKASKGLSSMRGKPESPSFLRRF